MDLKYKTQNNFREVTFLWLLNLVLLSSKQNIVFTMVDCSIAVGMQPMAIGLILTGLI